MTAVDRDDPAVRATLAAARAEGEDRRRRRRRAFALVAAAVAVVVLAAATLGGGATAGAVVLAVVLAGGALAVWPWTWSLDERRHHRLAAIWREARPGTAGEPAVPWDRFAAWARADGAEVVLVRLRWAGDPPPGTSPLSEEPVRRLAPDAVEDAAAAMEALRAACAADELAARQRHLEAASEAERRALDAALARVDATAADHERHAEAAMLREVAAQEAGEREAQAAAVARALRRP